MTPEQFDRWKDFATRLVRHAQPQTNAATRSKAEEVLDLIMADYEGQKADIHGWDGEGGKVYLCDDVANALEDYGHLAWNSRSERVYSKVGEIVMDAIRAGVDVALKPSMGVVGYDLDDIRNMYPEGIPDWVSEFLPEDHEREPGSTGLWL